MVWCLLVGLAWAQDVQTFALPDALARLDRDGPDLQRVRAQTDQARAVVHQVAAALQPVLVANGSYVHNNAEVVLSFSDLMDQLPVPLPAGTQLPDDVVIQPLQALSGGVTVKVPLVDVPTWYQVGAARQGREAADRGADAARSALQGALISAGAAVSAAEGRLAASERAVVLAEEHLVQVEASAVVGTSTSVDVLRAKADVLARRSERAQAEADRDSAREGLGALLGVDGPARLDLPETLEVPKAPERSPRSLASQASVQAADAKVHAAAWSYAPQVSATGTAQASTNPYPTGLNTLWRVGVDATWVLWGGGRGARLDAARAARTEVQARAESDRLGANKDTRDAERGLRLAEERLGLAEQQLALASEAAELARRGFEVGTVSALESRDAEQRQVSADVAHEAAKAAWKAAAARLAATTGATW